MEMGDFLSNSQQHEGGYDEHSNNIGVYSRFLLNQTSCQSLHALLYVTYGFDL